MGRRKVFRVSLCFFFFLSIEVLDEVERISILVYRIFFRRIVIEVSG